MTNLRCIDEDEAYNFLENRESMAKALGMILVFPAENELQIDIDSEAAMERFEAALLVLEQAMEVEVLKKTLSKSGHPHYHITLKISGEYTPLEKIALQFMLSSDYIRESLSVLRYLHGTPQVTCFFEKP